MKLLSKIVALTVGAIAIQQCAFLYVENIYLNNDKEIVVEKVDEPKEVVEVKNETIDLRDGVDDIQVSDSGRYVSYMLNGKLTVLDSKENIEKTVDCDDEIVYCSWKTNKDVLHIFKKVKDADGNYFKFMPYDAKKDEIQELSDFERSDSKINITNNNDKIDEVAYSTLTSAMYIKILKQDGQSDLYYNSLENNVTRVRKNIMLDDIVVPSNANKCVMEMGGIATVLDSKENIVLPSSEKIKVLGTDLNGNVYFGEISEDMISKIYYKDINDENSKWQTVLLTKAFLADDIIINSDGTIFINDDSEKTVTEVMSKKSLKYNGEFLQGIKNGFISKEGNVLTKNYFEDLKKKQ